MARTARSVSWSAGPAVCRQGASRLETWRTANRTCRRHSAAGGRRGRCRGCGSCRWATANRSSGRPGAGSVGGCWSSCRRCGPVSTSAAGHARCWSRRRLRSNRIVRRQGALGCNDLVENRPMLARIRARASHWPFVGPRPDRRYRNRSSGCAWKALHRSRGSIARLEATGRHRHVGCAWSPLSGLNR